MTLSRSGDNLIIKQFGDLKNLSQVSSRSTLSIGLARFAAKLFLRVRPDY